MSFLNIQKLISVDFILKIVLVILSSSVYGEIFLEDIKVNSPSNKQVILIFKCSEEIKNFDEKFEPKKNVLVIRIENAKTKLKINRLFINKIGVDKILVDPNDNRLEIMIHLSGLFSYELIKKGKNLLVIFNTEVKKSIINTNVKKIKGVKDGYLNQIKFIDFKRRLNGDGLLSIELENSSIAFDILKRENQLIIEFQSTFLPEDLKYIMDLENFGTLVKTIETSINNGKTKFILSLRQKYIYHYERLDSLFTLEISKKVENKTKQKDKLISLNFQDISVRFVLQLIADLNNFNLVITDSVIGNITLRLDELPWEQALDIILKIKGLDKYLDGNVLVIAPRKELAEQNRERFESANKIASLAPLVSEYIQVNYAKASELREMLSDGSSTMLSERGSLSVDIRTNTLLLKDTQSVVDSIRKMLKVLDLPIKQVVIEARMVKVTNKVGRDLGVKWGILNPDKKNSARGGVTDKFNINLPAAKTAGNIAFKMGTLDNGKILDLELTALELENKAEIIATPRITTTNQKKASIEQGVNLPFIVSASSGATSVEFKKAVLSLIVTPQITSDQNLILDLVITQDSPGELVKTSTGNVVSIDTQKITTNVLVGNGETVVLGGIFQQTVTLVKNKVPIIGDIPLIGNLFKSSSQKNEKTELLIFVTPHIVMQSKFRS